MLSVGTVFPMCSCTETAASKGRQGGGAEKERALQLGDATVPILQAVTQSALGRVLEKPRVQEARQAL